MGDTKISEAAVDAAIFSYRSAFEWTDRLDRGAMRAALEAALTHPQGEAVPRRPARAGHRPGAVHRAGKVWRRIRIQCRKAAAFPSGAFASEAPAGPDRPARCSAGGGVVIEKWLEYTCDACGETEQSDAPNESARDVRDRIKAYGWRNVGRLDYCPACVRSGWAAQRVEGFGHG